MAIISSREEDSQLVATVLPYLEFVNGSSQNIILPVEGPTMSSSEKELMEYYATYNVWTGVRTAVVLTMFFLFTVTIILYKSKCKRHSSYELHPSLEDLPGRPLEYYDYWCPTPVGGGGGDNFSHTSKDMFCRIFDDGVVDPLGSAPLPTHMKGDGSFPSIYSSFRIKSLPGSVLRMNFSRMGSLEKEEISRFTVPSCYSTPTRIKKPRLWSVPNASSFLSSNAAPDDCLPSSPDEIFRHEYLRVPGVRLQSTGSSSDGYSIGSSSFDLPYDSTPMTYLGVPGRSGRSKPLMPTGGIDWEADQATAEWLQTIDINVIQPTPNVSPCGSICGSVRSISDNASECAINLSIPKRSRSCSQSSIESREVDTASMASDSVFLDDLEEESNVPLKKFFRSPVRTLKSAQSLDETSRRSSLLKESSPRLKSTHSSLKQKRTVHSFRLPINPAEASSPMPRMLEGQPLQLPGASCKGVRKSDLGSSLGLPMGISLSGSCEKLAAHESLVEKQESISHNTSTASVHSACRVNSFDEEPTFSSYIVPGLRRVNSAMTKRSSFKRPNVKRSDSEVSSKHREELIHQDSHSSSSSTDPSDSVSFHLMVPHLSFDCHSGDTSRASSPSLSPSPPGSPMGPSLIVPSPFHRNSSSSKTSLRIQGTEGRGVLKRQYSQYMPISPREKCPSPFGLPTSFEEDEDAEKDKPREESGVEEKCLSGSSSSKTYDGCHSMFIKETKF